jgi:hypothetical protein
MSVAMTNSTITYFAIRKAQILPVEKSRGIAGTCVACDFVRGESVQSGLFTGPQDFQYFRC